MTIGTYAVPAASITTWTDSSIVLTIPSGATVPACGIQQQAQYGGSAAQCGQLVITTANTAAAGAPSNAKPSIDTVTVTIGGKAPTHVAATQTIQSAIDAAAPGDLIMVDPASHNEMLIMWKPVRLQGVGAASSIINANAAPAGKLLDPWRRHINCLFGLTLSGVPMTGYRGRRPHRTIQPALTAARISRLRRIRGTTSPPRPRKVCRRLTACHWRRLWAGTPP